MQSGTAVTTSTYNSLNQMSSGAGSGFLTISGTLNKPGTVTVSGVTTYASGTNNAFTAVAPVVNGSNNIQISATNVNGYGATYTMGVNVGVSGGGTFSYDLNGNMLSDGVNTYEWDAANRLTAVNEPGGLRSEFKYDGQGRRVCITEKNSGTVTSVKNLIWEGMDITEARNQTDTLTNRYYPQGVQISGTSFYYTRDHLGSIREMTGTNGVVQVQYAYDPYGRQTQLSGTMNADFGFTGLYDHQPSGLLIAPYRPYSPPLARWISRDPAGEKSGINLYDYVFNDPVMSIDPLGLGTWSFQVGYDSSERDNSTTVSVTYRLDSSERQCCSEAVVDRYKPTAQQGMTAVEGWTEDKADNGGFWNPDTGANAEGDAPVGPGIGAFGYGYRLPWYQYFMFKARCTKSKGSCAGKILSTAFKTWVTEGHWIGQRYSGYWE